MEQERQWRAKRLAHVRLRRGRDALQTLCGACCRQERVIYCQIKKHEQTQSHIRSSEIAFAILAPDKTAGQQLWRQLTAAQALKTSTVSNQSRPGSGQALQACDSVKTWSWQAERRVDQPQGRRVQREGWGEDSFPSGLARDQPSVPQLQQPSLLDGPGPDTASLNSRMREKIHLAQANQNRLAFFYPHQIPQQPHVCCSGITKHCRVWSHTSSRTLKQQNHHQTEHEVCWGNPAQECTAINKRRRSWNLSRITRGRWRHGARGPFSIWWRKGTSALAEFGRRRRWRRGGGISPSDWEVDLEWVAAHSRESLQYCSQLRRWRRPGRVWADCQCNTEGTLWSALIQVQLFGWASGGAMVLMNLARAGARERVCVCHISLMLRTLTLMWQTLLILYMCWARDTKKFVSLYHKLIYVNYFILLVLLQTWHTVFSFSCSFRCIGAQPKRQLCQCCCYFTGAVSTRHAVLLFLEINQPVKESIYSFLQILDVWPFTTNPDSRTRHFVSI